ncbi:uncharacterized protein OCT59_008566 [Rhizophagus irregularis]|uniref:uncharacterized protein n=1 Tax=Rhizophagus irregularis TaxID=588596 RepID=UPI003320D56D|nr:hypothetical protein OCT59_008566 [Rhizophagus irregularis]
MYTPHAVSVIPELVGHILELIPSSNFGPHLLEVSPIWKAEAERVLWKWHKKSEEAYDRAVERRKKQMMLLVDRRRRIIEIVTSVNLNGRRIKRLVKS